MMMSSLKKGFISLVFTGMIILPSVLHASEKGESQSDTLTKEEKFNPGPFILEHIGDSYFWHILHYKNKAGDEIQWAIPLPVIVYSHEKGLNVFMSSRFEHGHASFKGFHIAAEGEHKGKI